MNLSIRPWTDADREPLRAALHEPELAPHFDKFLGPDGLEHKLHDRRLARDGIRVAEVDGVLAGFGVPWVLPQAADAWLMFRVGVRAAYRGRGIGSRLAEALLAFAPSAVPAGARLDLACSAWVPNEPADRLAARFSFVHERWFWLMERPRGGAPEPEWPAGVEIRPFDRSDAMLRDWIEAFNDSFSSHYRFVPATEENTRSIAADPAFRPDGLALAYLGGRCAGFCRNERHATRGEIGVLGTTHAARGLGLGRALLRWGVRWLEEHATGPVTLLVDGDNESALGLYRSEGFVVSRTRRIWGRRIEAGA
jgi:mycothiol synthase